MFKTRINLVIKTIFLLCGITIFNLQTIAQTKKMKTLYDFNLTDIDGKVFHFSTLKGKKVMIVNTASECGYTYQYANMELLSEKYKNQNFIIVGIPSNDFGAQEPGTEVEIKNFCSKNYGVSFPMMSKISVVGEHQDLLYKWLTSKAENGQIDSEVKWNFQKFLIDENGKLFQNISHKINPDSEEIIHWIESK